VDEKSIPVGSMKLAELDRADIEAVRRFLPGKILGRSAALLALLLLVLAFAGSLDVAIEKLIGFPLRPPWFKYTLLFGVPFLIVAAQILVEWRAERSRQQTRNLAVRTEAVEDAYFRIGPYLDTPQDRANFDRADKVQTKVLDCIVRSDAVPLYMTGDSGTGKSSVLNAFVLPGLRDVGWTIAGARAWQDPETALRDAIAKLAAERKWKSTQTQNLRGLLETVARRAGNILIILDQFEEFIILADSKRRNSFIAFVADLRATPINGLRLLLVLRSDYQAAMEDAGLPPLRQSENWHQVGRFTIAAGTRFLKKSGLELQPNALDRIANSASQLDDSPGLIRPITLNVVGHVLSQGRASAPSLDAGRLVRHYIEQSVGQPAIREFAPRVLKELITEQALNSRVPKWILSTSLIFGQQKCAP
jgi:hypothetical protein